MIDLTTIKPMLSDKEIALLLKNLNQNDVVLEYGCGGSTVFFPNMLKMGKHRT